jgi:PncC family amidohydrolase
MPNDTHLSRQVGQLLNQHNLWLATAESCTGGLLGHLITAVSGSSSYYLGGFITYSNEAKQCLLGVASETLAFYGAVSSQTVREMARGARDAFGAQPGRENIVAISISGIAGPGGGTPEKPVGTVWIGLSAGEEDSSACFHFAGGRQSIKRQSAHQALEMLAAWLMKA